MTCTSSRLILLSIDAGEPTCSCFWSVKLSAPSRSYLAGLAGNTVAWRPQRAQDVGLSLKDGSAAQQRLRRAVTRWARCANLSGFMACCTSARCARGPVHHGQVASILRQQHCCNVSGGMVSYPLAVKAYAARRGIVGCNCTPVARRSARSDGPFRCWMCCWSAWHAIPQAGWLKAGRGATCSGSPAQTHAAAPSSHPGRGDMARGVSVGEPGRCCPHCSRMCSCNCNCTTHALPVVAPHVFGAEPSFDCVVTLTQVLNSFQHRGLLQAAHSALQQIDYSVRLQAHNVNVARQQNPRASCSVMEGSKYITRPADDLPCAAVLLAAGKCGQGNNRGVSMGPAAAAAALLAAGAGCQGGQHLAGYLAGWCSSLAAYNAGMKHAASCCSCCRRGR